MAAPLVPLVKFSFLRKIEWSEFGDLPTKNIIKDFATAYNDVVYYWRSEFNMAGQVTEPDKFNVSLYFMDGPPSHVEDVECKLRLMQDDPQAADAVDDTFALERGGCYKFYNFDYRDANSLQQAHDFMDSKPLFCQIKLKIPLSAFLFNFKNPVTTATSSEWMCNLFEAVEDPERAMFSNAKIVSSDGAIFYCHKIILGFQSPRLAAMLRHPPAEGQEEGTYPFSTMGTGALKAFLEFLYTSKVTFTNLTTTAVIEVADAAEQYGFKNLKEGCRAVLWDHAVEKPEECFSIVRFANLHRDTKNLKDRAMEVLARNFRCRLLSVCWRNLAVISEERI